MALAIEAGKLAQNAEQVDLPWRVISLLNIFRLLAPMVLLLVFFFNAPDYTIGGHLPGMFLGVCAAWFSIPSKIARVNAAPASTSICRLSNET